jgi:hypothetical protein
MQGNGGRGAFSATEGDEEEQAQQHRTSSRHKAADAVCRGGGRSAMTLREFTKSLEFIPMRLTEEERRYLAVLENALDVSEYTDVVDVTFSYTKQSKHSRILQQLVDMLSISCGLMMSNNLSQGESILIGRSLDDNVPLFADLFEIGRRYKIMNPNKMRGTYGKMMYLLMDVRDAKNNLSQHKFVKDILTVRLFCRQKGCEEILEDPLLAAAAGVTLTSASSSSSSSSSSESGSGAGAGVGERSAFEAQLISKYVLDAGATGGVTAADVSRVVASIADNQAYLAFNVLPVQKMIGSSLLLLSLFFSPSAPLSPLSPPHPLSLPLPFRLSH